MSLYLLDTDTISLIEQRHPTVTQRVATHPTSDVAISVISVQEQVTGWLSSINRARQRPQIENAYQRLIRDFLPIWRRFDVVPYHDPAILRFEYLRSRKLTVGRADLRIAAVALVNGLIVVTRNRRDLRAFRLW